MKPKSYILLIILAFTLKSCSEGIAVFVRIFGLDSNTETLEIGFDFKRFVQNQNVEVRNIEIYQNDFLIYVLESESKAITSWKFPQLPEGFRIKYPESNSNIRGFLKSDKLRFEFKGVGKYAAYGSWEYKPKFTDAQHRWLFDEKGNKKINIDCSYEPWIGKDIIKISSNARFHIDIQSFHLVNEKNETIDFEVRSKEELTTRVALVLENDRKEGDELLLSFKAHNGETFKEKIGVPDKSTIGIAGKFNDL